MRSLLLALALYSAAASVQAQPDSHINAGRFNLQLLIASDDLKAHSSMAFEILKKMPSSSQRSNSMEAIESMHALQEQINDLTDLMTIGNRMSGEADRKVILRFISRKCIKTKLLGRSTMERTNYAISVTTGIPLSIELHQAREFIIAIVKLLEECSDWRVDF